MSILFYSNDRDSDSLEKQFREQLAEHSFTSWSEIENETGTASDNHDSKRSRIDYVIAWNPPPNLFEGLHNLKAIFSMGAGVDHLLDHPGLPMDVPLARLEDAGMGAKMAEYVLLGTLMAQRTMVQYRTAQNRQHWDLTQPDVHARDVEVGIMGLGAMGHSCATRLLQNHYNVRAWTARPKEVESIRCFHGQEQLTAFLKNLSVLVCLLPLTDDTRKIINADLLATLPDHAFLINAARGAHLDQSALLQALDNNTLAGALLDVTDPEPLPAEHPLWSHEKVTLTPHVAAPTQENETIDQIVANIRRMDKGEPLRGLVNRQSGY